MGAVLLHTGLGRRILRLCNTTFLLLSSFNGFKLKFEKVNLLILNQRISNFVRSQDHVMSF